jgi:hypothetical protein
MLLDKITGWMDCWDHVHKIIAQRIGPKKIELYEDMENNMLF